MMDEFEPNESDSNEAMEENFGKQKPGTGWVDISSLKRIKIPLLRSKFAKLIIDSFE